MNLLQLLVSLEENAVSYADPDYEPGALDREARARQEVDVKQKSSTELLHDWATKNGYDAEIRSSGVWTTSPFKFVYITVSPHITLTTGRDHGTYGLSLTPGFIGGQHDKDVIKAINRAAGKVIVYPTSVSYTGKGSDTSLAFVQLGYVSSFNTPEKIEMLEKIIDAVHAEKSFIDSGL